MRQKRAGSSRREFIKKTSLAAGGLTATAFAAPVVAAESSRAVQESFASPAAKFAHLIARGEPLMAPGAFEVLTARMIEMLGFEAAVVGGSAVSANGHGIPDHGLVSVTELIEFSSRIAQSIDLPVMADADDCGGSAIAVYRAVQGFERGGVASVMIEDHVQAKHLGSKGRLVPVEEMVNKVRAAVDARKDQHFMIIARADALSVGLTRSEALDRGGSYTEAGADMLFFPGLSQSSMPEVADQVKVPLMTTVSDTPLDELRRNKVSLAVYASHAVNAAMGAAFEALRELKETGRVSSVAPLSREIKSELIRTKESIEKGRKYGLIRD